MFFLYLPPNLNSITMKKIIVISFISLLLLSCSNPMKRKYDKSKLEEDMIAIKESGKMDKEDAEILIGWMAMHTFEEENLSGKTYQQLLDEAKDYKKKQIELNEKAKKEEADREEKLNKALQISIIDYKYIPSNIRNNQFISYHGFKCLIHNKTDKKIKALKFKFNVYDVLGDEIVKNYTSSLTKNIIEPLSTFQDIIYFGANEFSSEEQKLQNSNFEDLKFKIFIEKIVFADDSELM